MILTSEQFEKLINVEVGLIEQRLGKRVTIVTHDGLRSLHQDFLEERIRDVQIASKVRNAVQAGALNFFHYLNYRLFE